MRKLLASLILLIMAVNILPAASSMSNGVDVEYIPPAFNLGIGYSAPTSKLHVKGTTTTNGFTMNGNSFSILPSLSQGSILFAKQTGVFAALDNGASSNAKVLTVNGNTLSWKTASGGGASNINGLSDGITYGTSVFLGSGSGGAPSTGDFNTALGYQALISNTTGWGNTASGYSALASNTTGDMNTAIGHGSLGGTEGNYNTATGYQSIGGNNSSGTHNTASGYVSLYSNTTGSSNTASGGGALYYNTTGSNNTASGASALYYNTTGSRNTASGGGALFYNVSGANNTAVGLLAGEGSTGLSFSNGTFLGYQTGLDLTTGGSNTLVGFNSGNGITIGAKNITIGYLAGDNITTGSSNIIIGDTVDAPSGTASNQLNIGNTIYGNTSTGNVAIGTTSPSATLDVVGTLQYTDGNQSAGKVLTSDASGNATWQATSGASSINGLSDGKSNVYNVYLGNGAGAADTGTSYSTGVGIGALKKNVSASGLYNSAFGYQSMNGNTSGIRNSAFGSYSLYLNTTGSLNTATGYKSLYANTTGSYNTATGYESLYANTIGQYNTSTGYGSLYANTTGDSNTAVGTSSLGTNTIGSGNTAIGESSLYNNTTGDYNTLIGHNAGVVITTGSNNTGVGTNSLYYNNTGSNLVAMGYQAAYGALNQSHSNGVFLGYQSGYANTTGDNNIAIGYQAGDNVTTGSSNITIGYDINAVSATNSNQINIGNTFYGQINNGNVGIDIVPKADKMTLNGVLAVRETTAPSLTGSYGKIYVDSTTSNLKFLDDAGTSYDLLSEIGVSSEPGYILITHETADGVDGGTATSGSWQTRPINSEKIDTGNYASVASNIITLAAGTYQCDIVSEAHGVGTNQLRLYNNTNAVVLGYGPVEYTVATVHSATLSTRFVLTGTTNLIIQHRTETNQSTDGFGSATAWTGNPETHATFKCTRW